MRQILDCFPSKIEDFYRETWARILDQPSLHAAAAKNVLVWVLSSERSLKIRELRYLVATCPRTHKIEDNRLVDERTLMRFCRGLVSVEEGTDVVRFVRKSR